MKSEDYNDIKEIKFSKIYNLAMGSVVLIAAVFMLVVIYTTFCR